MWPVRKSAFPHVSLLCVGLSLLAIAKAESGQVLAAAPEAKSSSEIKALYDQVFALETENVELHEQVTSLGLSLAAWGDNAAEASAEAEVFRRQYNNLKLRMEALGITLLTEQNETLEQRLIKSVRDLNLVRQQKEAIQEQLLGLSEAVVRYLKTTAGDGDPQSRLSVETELRATNETLGVPTKRVSDGDAIPASRREGIVLGCKSDLSLLVINLGSLQGARVGMFLTVVRGDNHLAHARVVQVRDQISGAMLERDVSGTDQVKVGDQIRVDAF